MKNQKLRQLYYHVRYQYFTMNNAVIAIALLIAAGWAWGSVQAMERNYALQKNLDRRQQELRLTQLELDTLRFEQKYYQSDEYKELAVRERLGLAQPGEKVLILPANTAKATKIDSRYKARQAPSVVKPSNLQQWGTFLFGGAS